MPHSLLKFCTPTITVFDSGGNVAKIPNFYRQQVELSYWFHMKGSCMVKFLEDCFSHPFEFGKTYTLLILKIYNLLTKNDAKFRCPIKKSIKWDLVQASTSYLNFFQNSDMPRILAPANTVYCWVAQIFEIKNVKKCHIHSILHKQL